LRSGEWHRGRECFKRERAQMKDIIMRAYDMLSAFKYDEETPENSVDLLLNELKKFEKEKPYENH